MLLELNKNNNPNPGLPKNEQTVLPMGDDRLGRLDFDFMRLKNPATGQIPEGIRRKEFYFMHSYEVINYTDVKCLTDYFGHKIVSVLENENIFGVQFHPERSGKYGLEVIEKFNNL